MNHKSKIGKDGDFITAPELGTGFAKCISNQLEDIFAAGVPRKILELGAGTGKLGADLIANCEVEYNILELSANLRHHQQTMLRDTNTIWLDSLPSDFSGVVIANEVLDAMPVNLFCLQNNKLLEYFVQTDKNLKFKLMSASDSVKNFFDKKLKNLITENNYTSEINLYINPWMHSIAKSLNTGAILIFDYGFSRNEYYHPQRNQGTLMCHHKHRAHDQYLLNPGQHDITAHVDFSLVAESGAQYGLDLQGYTTLAAFLLNTNILDVNAKPSEINTLTSPTEMGEIFKAISFTKNINLEMIGFSEFDKSYML